MSDGHIYVQHPNNSNEICWICGLKRDEHLFTVERKTVRPSSAKILNKNKNSTIKKRQRLNVQS